MAGAALGPAKTYAAEEAKVQINDSLLPFHDARPFIDGNQSLQVPLRPVAEKLGFQVEWGMAGDQVRVTLIGDKTSVTLTTGQSSAIVNGERRTMPSSPFFQNSTVYVPLRFLTETTGLMTQWDQRNYIAIICKDGKYHAPAWYKPKEPTPAPADQPQEKQLVKTALKFEGTPYAWGGTSPNGFDCSGFVSYIFSQYGIDLPHTSSGMYSKGSAVSDLQEGDLVFFAQGKGIDHVGIYVGNGKFVSATTSHGVKVDSLTTGYWSSSYVGAKRVL
jgi:peptidoglycan endopeptidase LytE